LTLINVLFPSFLLSSRFFWSLCQIEKKNCCTINQLCAKNVIINQTWLQVPTICFKSNPQLFYSLDLATAPNQSDYEITQSPANDEITEGIFFSRTVSRLTDLWNQWGLSSWSTFLTLMDLCESLFSNYTRKWGNQSAGGELGTTIMGGTKQGREITWGNQCAGGELGTTIMGGTKREREITWWWWKTKGRRWVSWIAWWAEDEQRRCGVPFTFQMPRSFT
jgi:hypothetical protein